MDDRSTVEHRLPPRSEFTGGPDDEGRWLDVMQYALASFGTYEFMVKQHGARLEQRPELLRM